MNKSNLFISLLLTLFAVSTWAQGPNNSGTYYQAADGKKGKALKTAFFNIIKNPDVVSYSGLYDAYVKTDTRPNGYVRDWYSDSTRYRHKIDNKGNYSKEGDMYNREHSIPQSWFSEASPMKSDIVHVLPTDGYVNNRRSNYPFGEVGNVTYQSYHGYSKLGSSKTSGYSGTVFEPNDEIKGDIARIYFYMVTCYEDRITNWTSGTASDVISSDKYQGLKTWCMDMMMRWSKNDPVDSVEIARNNAVQEVQGNRNPFVDYPGLENYVWGDKVDVAFSYDSYGSEGGDSIDVDHVEEPVFSPMAGTYKNAVTVTLSCSTRGADIYYTLDGTEPSISARLYTSSGIYLTDTTTVKAVAYLDGMYSTTATATYSIEKDDDVQPVEGEIALNNEFFGVSWTGARPSNAETSISGTKNGITITYSLGSSSNMYCNNAQIRMYGGNELKIESSSGGMSSLEFVTIDSSKKLLLLDGGGEVNGYTWTGYANSVTFGSEANHIKMSAVKVTLAKTEGISETRTVNILPVYYDLQGRRVKNPTKGLYILNGRKVILR